MEIKSEKKPENINSAAQAASVNPANVKTQSLFAGRTFGMGAGNETFMTKEVKSALDPKVDPKVDPKDPGSKPEDVPEKE
ncbi:MAG: hypothetical protein LBE98_04540 [Puniceicoccales bacterium]|jgi:hypothetical protein|nr:hypothetical protein [Puniceicoccales bacterium]